MWGSPGSAQKRGRAAARPPGPALGNFTLTKSTVHLQPLSLARPRAAPAPTFALRYAPRTKIRKTPQREAHQDDAEKAALPRGPIREYRPQRFDAVEWRPYTMKGPPARTAREKSAVEGHAAKLATSIARQVVPKLRVAGSPP